MRIFRLFILTSTFLVLAGCGMTLRSGWADFNAYFNTYYNASTTFNRAYEQVERQNRREQINPERPIRIHRTPPRVAQNEFEEVILTSADILRNHNESRWIDNAIELIGKSYFYQQQYFSADQKFIELYNNALTPQRRQNAIIWRGRVFLEMSEYNAGINYLSNQLFASDLEWDEQNRAEVKLILAQLYVAQERWDEAENTLSEALPLVNNRVLRFRGNFLHGQLLEIQGDYDRAFDAFTVSTHRSNIEFPIVYHAKVKMGEMARNLGDYQWAYNHFRGMSRDDKFYEFLGDIEYQMARTMHLSGNIEDSEILYERLLRRNVSQPSREGRSKIYYGLAEIHRIEYLNFSLAAAYYDSSARQANDLKRMPFNYDAQILARSFGDYARLTSESSRLDSLLWLGQLNEAEFDSVITIVRERKVKEMQRQARESRQTGNMIVMDDMQLEQADEITDNGFLNHKNAQITRQMNQAFSAYWGPRPLVDDWRRQEAVRSAIVEREEMEPEEVDEMLEGVQPQQEEQQILVDVSEVPFTEEAQGKTRQQIAAAEYEIGNVFFLTLNMPDSAANHYTRVVNRYPDSRVAPQALYTLSELYTVEGDSAQATLYASRLVDEYPRTIYARRISERFGFDLEEDEFIMTREDTIRIAYDDIIAAYHENPGLETAEKLREFRKEYPDSDKAGLALYRSALEYLENARKDPDYVVKSTERDNKLREWRLKENQFRVLQDSAKVMIQDTTLTESELDKWNAIADSSLTSPDMRDYFPYVGAKWDSARVILADISENFANFTRRQQVELLYDEIKIPAERPTEIDPDKIYESDVLDSPPKRKTDIQEFLDESGFQEVVDEFMVSGILSVMVTVGADGIPTEINLGQDYDDLGMTDSLTEAILNYMEFEPALIDGQPVKATFELELELNYR